MAARGPCPALNSLANHGFLPHSGKNITAIDLIRGAFEGLGLSPEFSVVAGVAELLKSYTLASFDLHELSNHGFIDHDCSLSRPDIGDGDNNDFNETIWSVPLQVLEKYSIVTPQAIGQPERRGICLTLLIILLKTAALALLHLAPWRMDYYLPASGEAQNWNGCEA